MDSLRDLDLDSKGLLSSLGSVATTHVEGPAHKLPPTPFTLPS